SFLYKFELFPQMTRIWKSFSLERDSVASITGPAPIPPPVTNTVFLSSRSPSRALAAFFEIGELYFLETGIPVLKTLQMPSTRYCSTAASLAVNDAENSGLL